MRLFQAHTLHDSMGCPAPTPPFLAGKEGWRNICLLRETTSVLRAGQQRLGTPDRMAILELSAGVEKHRLGKQQTTLSDIARRCREQEVRDLSLKIAAKLDVKTAQTGQIKDSPHQSVSASKIARRRSKPTDNPCDIDRKLEKCYKNFPARKIMRQPGRLSLLHVGTNSTKALPSINVTSAKGAYSLDRVSSHFLPLLMDPGMYTSVKSDRGLQGACTIYWDPIDSLFRSVPVALSERQQSFRGKDHLTKGLPSLPQQRQPSFCHEEHVTRASTPERQSFSVSIRFPASSAAVENRDEIQEE